RLGDSPYRMGFEPIRLLQRISNVALSPPIPTLQTSPGATIHNFQQQLLFVSCDIVTGCELNVSGYKKGLFRLTTRNTYNSCHKYAPF
ncbi:MAG: hypothetical protein SWH54_14990, partial [Thermodesulfobacteriota bacterium]|nr:hypothetical protein [Thermodesulfobacteriota bacterium]